MTNSSPSGSEFHREVRARFSCGKIEPLEDLDLAEGEGMVIIVKAKSRDYGEEAKADFDRSTGSWTGTLDFDAFIAGLYANRRNRNHDLPSSLFGVMKGSVTTENDIISPIDVEWDALS